MTRRRHTFYQMVMRRLVRRYIHQSRKTMRQDGVSEDDLLEIKQDISSLRYELREDRKREVARTIGHLEGLKREIVSELRNQFQSFGGIKPVAPDPNSKIEGASSIISPEGRTEMADEKIKHTHSNADDQKAFKHSELLARPQSLACGQETQCIYDEIKQLALINTAYERSKQTMPPSQALPVSTYTTLKDEIILGVKNELVGMIKQLCEVSDTSVPSTCSDSSEPKGTFRPPSIASTSRRVLQHEQTPRGDTSFPANLSSGPHVLRSALSVTQTPRQAEFGSRLERKQSSRSVTRQMSSQYLGSSAGMFICPVRESVSHPLRPVYQREHPTLNESDGDSSNHRLEKNDEKSVR